MMRSVHVQFFASAREVAGCDRAEIRWEGEAAVAAEYFWRLLESRFPGLGALRAGSRLARNLTYLGDGEMLFSGDEVAVIPPVSGG